MPNKFQDLKQRTDRAGAGARSPGIPVVLPGYFLRQHAEPLQQAEPSQHPPSRDFPNEVPNVSNKRAVRLNTPVVIFFMTILL